MGSQSQLVSGVSVSKLRDTDADWEELGKTNPYFGVLADPRFLTDNMTEESRAAFFAAGDQDITYASSVLRRRYPDFNPRSALDFGCGVGRLTRALVKVTGEAHGIDISPSMLEEARRDAPEGVSFSHEIPDRQFDWLVSIIVFQHIPPVRGYVLLRELLKRLAPGGFLTLQISLYRDAKYKDTGGGRFLIDEEFTDITNDDISLSLDKGVMLMHDYDLSKITGILFENDFNHYEVAHTDHGGFHGVFIHGRKNF